MERFDCSGYVTRNDLLCSDGRTIRKDAFKHCDGQTVPVVYNHNHNNPDNILGHALLENREDGVYGYIAFNDSESGIAMQKAVRHGDVRSLSIFANKLKQSGGDVLHGFIREVSIVMAGANPGAYIDTVMAHGEDTDEGLIMCYDENIMVHHYEESEDDAISHAEDSEGKTIQEVFDTFTDEQKTVVYALIGQALEDEGVEHSDESDEDDTISHAENNKEEAKVADEKKTEEKTVKDVFDTLNEEQKTVVYALIGQALEDAGADEEDDDVKHSEGGYNAMNYNIFENGAQMESNVLTHADQEEILRLAKSNGSFKAGMEAYVADHKDTLAHGFENYGVLFPEFKDLYPGAPELIERDRGWIGSVMNKARKSPVSRVRTRQADARAAEIRAKGYNRENEKTVSGNIQMIMRTTEPQTVFYRDNLHRDDIVDITDFDVVAYQKTVMKHGLEEEVALAALVGDGRAVDHPDKIHEDKIRPIWTDSDIYTIKAQVDIAAARKELQGTNTGAFFGDNFVYAEAFITAITYAREKYRGKGVLDLYCAPHLLNVMLLARDMNGRRIYDSKAELAKVLNVGEIHTVEQMDGLTRTDDKGVEHKLLGLFVDMSNYTFGSTKGGEITSFEDFDIDFNNYKYLMETRLSGALTVPLSAIAIEEPVAEVVG